MDQSLLAILVDARHHLHAHPELSTQEVQTKNYVEEFITKHCPSFQLAALAKTGLIATMASPAPGPHCMIRCELDALPILEGSEAGYASINEGKAHACGHDGHMAIALALAMQLQVMGIPRGRVSLLFQPAEETGQGARSICRQGPFLDHVPDYMMALHNIPGIPMHEVILVPDSFSAAVIGMEVNINGRTSHAAQPELGINPSLAIAELVQELRKLIRSEVRAKDWSLVTPVHLKIGDRDYGISPGQAEAHFTLRSWSNEILKELRSEASSIVCDLATRHQLEYKISWHEFFPAGQQDIPLEQCLAQAATNLGMEIKRQEHPFRFGEDFSWYAQHCNCYMFGLGAGVDCPPLHDPSYDFPDPLIETGSALLYQTLGLILANEIDVI